MESEKLKLLGVTIDCGLNLNVDISNEWKKASQRIGVIIRLRNLIPKEAKFRLTCTKQPFSPILPIATLCDIFAEPRTLVD